MNEESPAAAVRRVLLDQFNIEPTNVQLVMLIEAVQDATPPPLDVTIGMLKKILQSMSPSHAIDLWAHRKSQEIVELLSKHPTVQKVASLIQNEHMWCELEGVISAMLWRVTQGIDLQSPPIATDTESA